MGIDLYEILVKWRKEIMSWVAFIAMFVGGLELYFTPKVLSAIQMSEERVLHEVRNESNKNMYLFYSEFALAYGSIPEPKPHQVARLEEIRSKQALFLSYMSSSYVNQFNNAIE